MGYHGEIRLGSAAYRPALGDIDANLAHFGLQELLLEGTIPFSTREILLERSDFHVRLANTRGRRSQVSMLLKRMYSWRGYQWEMPDDPPRANEITLQACREEQTFGTITLRLDSASGLLADALYGDEIRAFRRGGRKVGELGRLAIDPEYGSKEVLASLFHLVYIFCRLRRLTDVFIEVNPRHVSFYQRMLGFEKVGEEKICERVGAPAVLLRLDLSHADEQITLHGGHSGPPARSLYPYFFSKVEEEGLRRRIVQSSVAAPKRAPAQLAA